MCYKSNKKSEKMVFPTMAGFIKILRTLKGLERVKGVEPSTSTLARFHNSSYRANCQLYTSGIEPRISAISYYPLLVNPAIAVFTPPQRTTQKCATTTMFLFLVTSCATQKLYEVNERINSYRYISDTVDYMKTPEEFYRDGGGDCEDFANAKKQALLDEGFPADKIRLVVIPLSFPVSHVMLEADGYLLDNRTDKIVPAGRYKAYPFTPRATVH